MCKSESKNNFQQFRKVFLGSCNCAMSLIFVCNITLIPLALFSSLVSFCTFCPLVFFSGRGVFRILLYELVHCGYCWHLSPIGL